MSAEVPAQIRQRRDAAHRCEPLDSGVRDPLDGQDTQASRFKPASITVDGGVFLVRGYVRDTLRSAGLKPIWSGAGRGWVLDVHTMPDALASLEHAGFHVTTRERNP